MKKSFFERIADLINGNPKEKCPDNKSEELGKKNDVLEASNSIDKKGALLDSIIMLLRSNYSGSKINMRVKSLSLYIEDNLFYDLLISENFKEQLIVAINNELGFEFGLIEIKQENKTDKNLTMVTNGCYIQVKQCESAKSISEAKIYSVPGNGSLIDEYISLSSEDIKSLPNLRYNIGAGRTPKLSDGSIRRNQIAIDDNPETLEFDKNKYVSRAHAYITYSETNGFLLNVEYSGTRLANKRTHIVRGNEKIEMNDIYVPEQLQDGDYIILSKYVQLLFKKA